MTSGRAGRGQLGALLLLRARMVRSVKIRVVLLTLLSLPILMSLVGMLLVDTIPDEQAFNIALGTPTIYLGFAVLCILAPLAAGGGYELFPPEQVVAYPIRPRTVFLGTLLLAPINLAWILNVVALVVTVPLVTGPLGWGTVRSTVSVLAFIALATSIGHAFAWGVVGIRQTRTGRRATWAAGAAVLVVAGLIFRFDYAFFLLDKSPTRQALANMLFGYYGPLGTWAVGVGAMVAGAMVAGWGGVRATGWALRRPGDQWVRDGAHPVRRRAPAVSVRRALVATDRASVWRSVPLRRGLLVLLILPGSVAAVAGLNWQSLVLLPGLVAAGAALLFGVNAFCLDGSGSLWLSTLPDWERRAMWAKTQVVAEVTLLSVAASLAGGLIRVPAPQHAGEVTATVAAALVATGLVVSSSLRAAVSSPHRADLRGPRDTPAPPGVMALHSLRLAVLTTFVGLFFSGLAFIPVWWFPLVAAVPFLAWSGLSLVETGRTWADPTTRARIVITVSGG